MITSFGILGLKLVLHITWVKAVTIGLLPFMTGAAIKIIAAVVLAKVSEAHT